MTPTTAMTIVQLERIVEAARAVADWRIDPARFLSPGVSLFCEAQLYEELSEAVRTLPAQIEALRDGWAE